MTGWTEDSRPWEMRDGDVQTLWTFEGLEVIAMSHGKCWRMMLPLPVAADGDIWRDFWNRIVAAAASSPWMPEEYCMNDWVADVEKFLKSPRSANGTSWPLDTLIGVALDDLFKSYGLSFPQTNSDLRRCFAVAEKYLRNAADRNAAPRGSVEIAGTPVAAPEAPEGAAPSTRRNP